MLRSYTTIQNQMIQQYKEAFKKHGDSELALMWSKSGQYARLESLTSGLALEKATILDFGCGLAHLKDFLDEKYSNYCYTGVDIVKEFIVHNDKKYLENNLIFNVISSYDDVKSFYDYIFISGVFNVLFEKNFEEQFKYIKIVLTYLFEKTNICLSVNFMNDDVDFINDGSYHQNVNELYYFVSKKLSKRLIIDQSSMPYEFTLKIFKNIEKENNIYKENNENC